MNGNLQVSGVIGVQLAAMVSVKLIPMHVFQTKLKQVLATAAVGRLVERLESGVNLIPFDEDVHWTIVDDLKAYLGSQAANMVDDSRDQQELALVTAETWVEDNISNAGRETIVGTAIVLYGYAKAESMIHELDAAAAV